MAEFNPNQAPDTGHEWDGIKELSNPPPRWWMIAFYLSFIWLIAYFVIYPSIPLIKDATKGVTGWTSIGEYKDAVVKYDAMRQPYVDKLAAMSAEQIINDPEMLAFANSYTKALFGDNCAPCHGSNGQGKQGMFPTLSDDDWLYGGTVENVTESITNGRQGIMPAHAGSLSEDQISKLTDFVVGGAKSPEGLALFAEAGCVGCHGDDAKGNQFVGSANLTDNIWRFGSSRDEVLRTIKYGVNQEGVEHTRNAVMPSFGTKLDANEIKLLTVKVWSLGGGQKE